MFRFFNVNYSRLAGTYPIEWYIIDLDIDTKSIREDLQIKFIDNTPEEIKEVTFEMNERLNNNWQTNEDDESLQKKFCDLLGKDYVKSYNLRIGQHFLRHNTDLFT